MSAYNRRNSKSQKPLMPTFLLTFPPKVFVKTTKGRSSDLLWFYHLPISTETVVFDKTILSLQQRGLFRTHTGFPFQTKPKLCYRLRREDKKYNYL